MFGVGFAILGATRFNVEEDSWNPVNVRMCSIRIQIPLESYTFTFICVHAPTDEKEADLKDPFWEQLYRLIRSCPEEDIKIVLGDFNAQMKFKSFLKDIIGNVIKY